MNVDKYRTKEATVILDNKYKMTVTLAEVATAFLDKKGLASSTVRSYELSLLPLLLEYGRLPIELINRQILIDYLGSLNNLKYTTHNRHQAIISALFNFAVAEGYIKFNPINQLAGRRPQRELGEHKTDELIRYLSQSQLVLIYELVKPMPRLEVIVYLLHRTGARISELLGLSLSDINQEERKFQVIGKGNKQRWCFYNQDTEEVIKKYIKYYRHTNHTALFTAQKQFSQVVTRVSYEAVHADWVKTICTCEELKNVRLHDLRHTFATERVGLMGIEELRALMGHNSINTTLRYQKVTSARAEEVAKKALDILTLKI